MPYPADPPNTNFIPFGMVAAGALTGVLEAIFLGPGYNCLYNFDRIVLPPVDVTNFTFGQILHPR